MSQISFGKELLLLKEVLLDKPDDGSQRCNNLCQFVGDIPEEVCNFLNLKNLNIKLSLLNEIFLGCDALSYDEVLSQYENKSKKYSFFDSWGINDDFEINGDGFFMVENLNGFLNEYVDIKNAQGMIPLLNFQSNFVLYNLDDKSEFGGLMFISQEGMGYMIAPSLLSYVNDFLDGLESGRYFVNKEGNLTYPSSWHDKKKLEAGLVNMDEYGEIIEPNNILGFDI